MARASKGRSTGETTESLGDISLAFILSLCTEASVFEFPIKAAQNFRNAFTNKKV